MKADPDFASAHRPRLDGARILVVEDDALVSMAIEQMCADHGCVVVEGVGHLAPAVGAAEKLDFDVAVVDLNLGGSMSFPVIDALIGRAKPFVVATGYAEPANGRLPASSIVLVKPFTTRQLGEALRASLASPPAP